MHLNKPLLIAGAAVALGVSGLLATQAVSAHAGLAEQTLASKIASKFNLDKNEVQKVFDEEHQAMRAEMEKKFGERIDQAVRDGKISRGLADQLLAKHEELRAYHESIKDKEPEEQRKLMKTKMNELMQWARDNNISKELMRIQMHHEGPMMVKDKFEVER